MVGKRQTQKQTAGAGSWGDRLSKVRGGQHGPSGPHGEAQDGPSWAPLCPPGSHVHTIQHPAHTGFSLARPGSRGFLCGASFTQSILPTSSLPSPIGASLAQAPSCPPRPSPAPVPPPPGSAPIVPPLGSHRAWACPLPPQVSSHQLTRTLLPHWTLCPQASEIRSYSCSSLQPPPLYEGLESRMPPVRPLRPFTQCTCHVRYVC